MKTSHVVGGVALVVAAVALGLWFVERGSTPMPAPAGAENGRVLYWYDPMKPEVHFDKPGKSPFMDMQLRPKHAGEEGGESHLISIDPRMVQNLGIRTAPVFRGSISREVHTTGIVAVDENSIGVVQARAAGWVERLHIRAAGDPVRRGEVLAEIYSPDLLSAEHELIIAARAQNNPSGAPSLLEAARNRLSLLGLTDGQIAELGKTGRTQRRVAFYSPMNGIVTELGVREGAQVSPGMNLFTVADLSKVWITAEISEAQANWIVHGQAAEARLIAMPGHAFTGDVDYVYPDLMRETRTLRARIVLDNPRLELKPGMYADVTLRGGAAPETLLVPAEALIRTGTRSTIIVADGEGRFHPVEVVAGDEVDGKIAILKGLKEGDQVVTSGQFLIDSEANLRGAFSQMTAPQGATGAEPLP